MRKLKLPGRDRSRPRLDQNDMKLIRELGIEEVREQVRRMVENKLKEPEASPNLPSAGNPVYKAMYACNATSRDKLFMSHRIEPEHELTEMQMKSIADMLMRWIVREYNFYQEEEKEKQIRLGDFFIE